MGGVDLYPHARRTHADAHTHPVHPYRCCLRGLVDGLSARRRDHQLSCGQGVDKTGLSGTDRVLGIVFGVVRGVVVVALLVLLAGLTTMPKDPWWGESALLGHFQVIALELRALLPPDMAAYFNF